MRLFTCKKYDFVVKKTSRVFPTASPLHPKSGWGVSFTEDCSNSDRFIFRSKYLWGKVMVGCAPVKISFERTDISRFSFSARELSSVAQRHEHFYPDRFHGEERNENEEPRKSDPSKGTFEEGTSCLHRFYNN
ncbi:Uncharacterized protein LB4E_2237 [Leptospira borgpetersenii str. 4E]|nr:Uncharacterized protein LB4E_2237 [Leptospira borgpetersenii str. 4E]